MLPETHRQVYPKEQRLEQLKLRRPGALGHSRRGTILPPHQGRNGSARQSLGKRSFSCKTRACRIEFALFLMCTIAHPPSAMA